MKQEYLDFFISKTKDPNTNWIFLEEIPRITYQKNKRFKPCGTCAKAIKQDYKLEPLFGPAVKCRKWEKPINNFCSHYESKNKVEK